MRDLYTWRRIHDENIDLRLNELIGERGKPIVFAIGKTPLDSQILSFDITEFPQSGPKSLESTPEIVDDRGTKKPMR